MAQASSRPYHSPRRQQSARDTRLAVLAAARQQFVEHGYAATSLAAIAAAAGVSLATVKLVAGTKAQLLLAAIESVIRHEEPGVPVVDQRWWKDMLAQTTAAEIVHQFATNAGAALQHQAALFGVVYEAAASEAEVRELEQRASAGRWQDVQQVAQRLSDLGALRADYDLETATDVIWAVASPQLFGLLVGRRGWSAERWRDWLCDSLTAQLLES